MKYNYAREKLSTARRCLMLPHRGDEARSLADAFHECSLGLHELVADDFPDYSINWYNSILRIINTDGITDPTEKKGTWYIKAESLTDEKKMEFSFAVDDLCSWFETAEE